MRLRVLASAVVLSTIASPAFAQQPSSIADDYARAERFVSGGLRFAIAGFAFPEWLPDDRLWYATATPTGSDLFLIDPTRGTKTSVFDNGRLVAALRTALGTAADSLRSPRAGYELSAAGDTLVARVGGHLVACQLANATCAAPARAGSGGGTEHAPETFSPDRTRAVFIRDWNLWMRDVRTGHERQLTHDGVENFGYATDNAGWLHSDRASVLWSPDSKKIATFQQDDRNVGEMYLVTTAVGHPELRRRRIPLAGDSVVSMVQRVIIDVGGDTPRVIRLQMPPDQQRNSLCDDCQFEASENGALPDAEWYPDGSHLAFVSTSRDHKHEVLRVADATTGAVRDVLAETVATFFESGTDAVNWRVLPASNEVIWYSERDNWGQLYLYDLRTGALKGQITRGEGNVTKILRVDEKARTLYLLAVGKEQGRNPYFQHLYRVGMDGRGLRLLTPEDATHSPQLSPSGRYVIDVYSRTEVPWTAVVRDVEGELLQTVGKADIAGLLAAGWKPPTPITVKARDGVTDLYGLMFVPTHLDSTKKYPIIDNIYPGPQAGSVSMLAGRSFLPPTGQQALAELGFVVVLIDGMGTPYRSKAFHDYNYGDLGDNTLPDQIAGMKELARRYPWIDIDRAGIYGHSGGGSAAAAAMFRYPDFFKVGVAESGNHDNRDYEGDWGERYQGLEVRRSDGSSSYDNQANENIAKNLKGKLLLVQGTADDNVWPESTYLVVEALIKANKDFDLLLLPNKGHSYGADSHYVTRRRWDYFVKNLLGFSPPESKGPGAP
jgi:dipeptidyl-peptidase 4